MCKFYKTNVKNYLKYKNYLKSIGNEYKKLKSKISNHEFIHMYSCGPLAF